MGFLFIMTSDERILISSLFDRLKQAGIQPKDAEADDFIRGRVLEQPSAPYLLVQSTLVMQQALAAAQSRIAGLEKKLAEAASPTQEPGGSFLSGVASLFGVGQPSPQPPLRPVQTPPPLPPQPAAASGYASQPIQQAPSRGGGFLQSALSTAAGVAGGALLFQGIENLIGHNPGPFTGLSGTSGGLLGGGQPVVENTEIVNNYINDPASTADQSPAQDDTPGDLDATADNDSLPDPGLEDPLASDDGGDFLGGDDSYV
jgi:hypothetical protein